MAVRPNAALASSGETTHLSIAVLVIEDDEKLATLPCRALAEDCLRGTAAIDSAITLQRELVEPSDVLMLPIVCTSSPGARGGRSSLMTETEPRSAR